MVQTSRRNRWSVLTLLVVVGLGSCGRSQSESPDTYVLVVSFDGFRWDYPELYDTPNFDLMAQGGVKAEYLISSFPTKTFPNHYTLATGLYPDRHGIINNSFYAPDLQGIYRIGDRDMVANGDAYFGEPIWVTAEKQGVKSASYFWVGSEATIQGITPSYWYTYDEEVPYLSRIDQVMKWLKLPLDQRPGLILLYYDEPDGTGHVYGPEHPKTSKVVSAMDSVLGYIRSELSELEYGDRVNLVVLSDHGMSPVSPGRYVNLNAYLREEWIVRMVGGNPVYLIEPAQGFADSVTTALNALEGLSAWQKEDIPSRLHYGTSSRFPGIVVVADSAWSIGTGPDPSQYTGGAHGYDNACSDMHTIFYAEGPAFREHYLSPPFSNVEVYGIIAEILGLKPVETDGDLSNVMQLFREK